MRLLGIFLTACVVLAAAQAMAAVLAVLVLIGLIYSLFTAPRETLGLVGLILAAGLFQRYPIVCIGLTIFAMIAKLLGRAPDRGS